MTRPWNGHEGAGTPFGLWCREQNGLESHQHSLTITDADWMFHKFRTNIDACGIRDVQLAMIVEVKSRNSVPTSSQQETLFYHHQLLCTCGKTRKVKRVQRAPIQLWHFGVFVLRLPGDTPSDFPKSLEWGIFADDGSLTWLPGTECGLIQLLRFDRRPDNPKRALCLRRHHSTRVVTAVETTPLGFEVERTITRRS